MRGTDLSAKQGTEINQIELKTRNGDGELGQGLRALASLSEDLGFGSQHPHGGSQLSVTPVPGDLMASSDLHGYQTHVWYIDIHASQHSSK